MIELEKMPLYNGIFHEMSKCKQWEYLPRNISPTNINYNLVFDYLMELRNKSGEEWFVITMAFIIGMNEDNTFRLLYSKNKMFDIRSIFHSLSSRRIFESDILTYYVMKSKIDLYNLSDIDVILEMIDMLNTGYDESKFLMMKMMNHGQY